MSVARCRSFWAPVENFVEYQFLGHATAQEDGQPVQQFRAGHQITVLGGLLLGIAQRRDPAGDNGDFMNRIGVLDRLGHDRVSGFMEGDNFLLLGIHHPVLLLQTRDHPVDGLVENPSDPPLPCCCGPPEARLH